MYNLKIFDMYMKILRGTIFGGIAFFLLDWLIYGILLMDYISANMSQCARPSGEMVWWAKIVSDFVSALLLTLILKWSGAKGIVDGLKIGAILGILYTLWTDLYFWSITTMYNNFGAMVVDVVAYTIIIAVVGLVIVLLWGKDKVE
jgi:hypothetical protein